MPTVTDYCVIKAGTYNASATGFPELQFQLPSTAPRYPAILMLRILPNLWPGRSLVFRIWVNGVEVFAETFSETAESYRTIHEVLEAKTPALLKTGANTILLGVKDSGENYLGGVKFSDIVLWFKHDV